MSIEGITGDPVFIRDPVNTLASQSSLTNLNYDDTLNKLEEKFSGNKEYQEDNYTNVLNKLSLSDSSVVATKLLQTVATDRTDALVYTLESILFNHWIYFSAKDKYKPVLYIDLPRENTSIRLNSQQTVALYFLSSIKYYMPNFDIDELLDTEIHKFRVNRVISLTPKTLKQIKDNVESIYLNDDEINEILNTKTAATNIFSIPDFREKCEEIFINSQLQYSIYASKENLYSRAYAYYACASLYVDETVTLDKLVNKDNTVMTYRQLLESLAIDISQYSIDDFLTLSNNIITVATSATDEEKTRLGTIQKAMSSLLLQLSSYSVQIIEEINESPLIVAPSTAIRASDFHIRSSILEKIESTHLSVNNIKQKRLFKQNLNGRDFYADGNLKVKESLYRTVEIKVKPSINYFSTIKPLGSLNCSISIIDTNSNIETEFNKLTNSQKLKLLKLLNY